MNRRDWAQYVLDQLRDALDNDRLSEDELRVVAYILRAAAERARTRNPDAAAIEQN